MEEQENRLTANQMIGELLTGLTFYGIVFYIVYRLIYNGIYEGIVEKGGILLLSVVVIVLQAIMVWGTFQLANRKAFKKGMIQKDDVSKVIKNISFIIVILLVLQVISTFVNIHNNMEKTLERDNSFQYIEKILSQVYDAEQMQQYQAQKQKSIQKIKNEVYQAIVMMEVGICIVYIGNLFIEKRTLDKRAEV